jgi:Right handed beta helix region
MRARSWLVLGALVLLLAGGLWLGGLWGLQQTGRGPGELIDYAKRRLQGHPRLEAIALPVLDLLRSRSGEPDASDLALPFEIPPLTPNPATPARAASASAAADNPRIIRVGPNRAITRIAVAAQVARDGSIIEIDPGDYVADVAVWDRAELTLRGTGNRVRLLAAGAHAEGKAIWVVRRGKVTIEDIEFVGARVPDRNGAGIRMEGGQLLVRRCTFRNNENGILTASASGASLEVVDSEFSHNGAGDGRSHGIYVGAIDSFRLRGSYLHHGNQGHLVKSRARSNRIEYNRLSDESGGRSSYELELPNGGLVEVVGNVVQQGAGSPNSIIVSYGAEGLAGPRNELRLAHNTVVNDRPGGGSFVRVSPGAGAVVLRNNLFVGQGKVDVPAGADRSGDRVVGWEELVRPAREDYRINAGARARLAAGMAPTEAALTPREEYVHPASRRPLDAPPSVPGALQAAP